MPSHLGINISLAIPGRCYLHFLSYFYSPLLGQDDESGYKCHNHKDILNSAPCVLWKGSAFKGIIYFNNCFKV